MATTSKLLLSCLTLSMLGCGDNTAATDAGPETMVDARILPPLVCEAQSGEVTLALKKLPIEVEKPIVVNSPPGDDRLFIMENQRGRILIYRDGQLEAEPFINLEGQIADRFEQGLLGLAFHPNHVENRKVYVSFTVPITGDVAVVEFTTFANNPDAIDLATGRSIITVPQPWSKHNGGSIHFGIDGFLYIGIGNSLSSAIADLQTAQDLTLQLGKILRIDIDNGTLGQAYAIPEDNPYVDTIYARKDIWHSGLRNPWGMYIDPLTGTMYIPDIGSSKREELNIVAAGVSGLNFGYPIMEGAQCQSSGCDPTGFVAPQVDYGRDEGCAIIGGTVYRGCNFPEYHGQYFYTDWCHMFVRSLEWQDGSIVSTQEWPALIPDGAEGEGARLSSVASGPNGELFLADHFDNAIYEVVAAE
ncbi:MAG: PQQ-dependent sugar dehydrogenase [Kofleriaceae bacterium]|nr:PQQ-dependent sugar dehydrogenase [Kofleriaceae bacterium]